jgi:hypothetical protein
MYATAEVRWFFPGPLPAAVRTWFEARGNRMAYQAPRRDLYLGLPDDSLSVKLREGRVEIKLRRQKGEFLRLHPQVTGVLERWQKWSFALEEAATVLPGISVNDSSWLPIDKHRGVARYRVAGNEPPVAVAPDVYPVQGCEVELVELYATGQAWWSLCFEAFGQGRALPEALLATARQFLGGGEPPHLEAGNSYGYPRWLAVLSPGQ